MRPASADGQVVSPDGRATPHASDIPWLRLVQWTTCIVLWVVAAASLLPTLELSLRAVLPLVVAAAIGRTVVALLTKDGRSAPLAIRGLSWAADAALLTGLLDITGGPFNPFIVIFVPYVWLAVAAGSTPWAVVVGLVATGGFGWLVLDHVNAELAEHHRLNDFPAHLFTMWLSGAAVAELVAHYVAQSRAAIAQRQRQLDDARERALRSEHLVSLTTLAAGAAHELSTPLATIAIAARELERQAERLSQEVPLVGRLQEDAGLIRMEVDRCQAILDGMSGRAPDGSPSTASPLPPHTLADLVRARLSDDQRSRLRVLVAPGVAPPAVAGAAVVQAISSLLKNAFDASEPTADVTLRFEQRGPLVRIEVHDRGPGMPPEVLRRAGEPFYTTKEAGRGLGLGLFLTRTVAEQAGGRLLFEPGQGTRAVLEIPAASLVATVST